MLTLVSTFPKMISCIENDFKAPVRAVKYLNFQETEMIVSGEVNRFKIYTETQSKEFILPVTDKITKFVKATTILYILTEFNVFYVKIADLFEFELQDISSKVRRILFNFRDRILHVHDENGVVWIASALGQVRLYSSNSNCEYSLVKSYTFESMSAVFYSASFLRRSADILEVAFGTIFSGIQLAIINCESSKSELVPVYQISGHSGTVFDVMYHPKYSNLLISCSDDRTIRIWDIGIDNALYSIKCLSTCYGHEARVWSIDVKDQYIASVSEDNSCRLWNLQGECLDILESDSFSKSLWSLSINDAGNKVAVGSNDGSICIYNLEKKKSVVLNDYVPPVDVFGKLKSFILSASGIIYTTETGHICKYSKDKKEFISLHQINSIRKYAEMAVNPHSPDTIYIGDLFGNIYILLENGCISSIKISPSASKVTKILPIDSNTILVELNEKVLYFVDTNSGESKHISFSDIKYKITSALLSSNSTLFIGTRQGDLVILNHSDSHYELVKIIKISEGESLKSIQEDTEKDFLYILDHSGTETALDLKGFEIIKTVKIGKGSFESYLIHRQNHTNNNSNIISYFNQHNFYLFDKVTGTIHEKISCGNGIRLWSLSIDDKTNTFTFGYVLNGKVNVFKGHLDRVKLLTTRSHGKEIRCATTIPNADMFISGSEDGLLRIRSSTRCIDKLHIMNTSIKCLSVLEEEERELLFVGGSNESLQVFSYTGKSFLNFLSSCPKFCLIGEVRILSLDTTTCWHDDNTIVIIAGYSDSSIKIIKFVTSDFKFKLIKSIENCHQRRCVQQIKILKRNQKQKQENILFLSAGANGSVYCWSIATSMVLDPNPDCCDMLWNISLHESGINALDCLSVDEKRERYLVLTGGEDGSISLFTIENGKLLKDTDYEPLKSVPSHNSTITAVKFIDSTHFVTTSIDQRVILHKIKDSSSSNDFTKVTVIKSVISDIAAMTLNHNSKSNNSHLTVYGVGQESFLIKFT